MPKMQLLNFQLRILFMSQHNFRRKKKKKKTQANNGLIKQLKLDHSTIQKIKPSADQVNILIKVIFSSYIQSHSLTERTGSNKKRM